MRIYLFEKDPAIISNLEKALPEEYKIEKAITTEEELLNSLHTEKIDLLLLDINELSLDLKDKISENVSYIIVFTQNSTTTMFKKSLELRANDFLLLPIKLEELAAALSKAEKYIREMPIQHKTSSKKTAKIISLMSSKGGVGKSVLAANLGYQLARIQKRKVLLIDTVPRYGCIDVLVDANEKKSMVTIPVNPDSDDAFWLEIQNSIIKREDGLDLLLAGDKSEDAPRPDKLRNILSAVKERYDYIIVDTDPYFSEINLALLEVSELILYISTSDVAALKNLKHGLETMKSYYYSTEKVRIVINRFDKLNELTVAELEKFLKYKIACVVPEDREMVLRSINKGLPFVCETAESDICKAMHNLNSCVQGKVCEVIPGADKNANSGKSWLENFGKFLGSK